MFARVFGFAAVLAIGATLAAQQPAKTKSPREALQEVQQDVIGSWKCTCEPKGTREEVQKGFWTEKMEWGWAFKGKDVWLKVDFDKGRNFITGELRYVPDKEHYSLTLTTVNKEKHTYIGVLTRREDTRILTLEREEGKDTHRLVFTFLHSNRFLYKQEVRADGKTLFALKWKGGATKEGEAFAVGSGKPECIVSGGTGTSAVSYMGKTYYVCCSGCRDEFNANAAKYVKEYEGKLAKKK